MCRSRGRHRRFTCSTSFTPPQLLFTSSEWALFRPCTTSWVRHTMGSLTLKVFDLYEIFSKPFMSIKWAVHFRLRSFRSPQVRGTHFVWKILRNISSIHKPPAKETYPNFFPSFTKNVYATKHFSFVSYRVNPLYYKTGFALQSKLTRMSLALQAWLRGSCRRWCMPYAPCCASCCSGSAAWSPLLRLPRIWQSASLQTVVALARSAFECTASYGFRPSRCSRKSYKANPL